jgi:hypothetical protein
VTDRGLRVIVTAPPYADFLADVVAHPLVSGLRLNTVMPVRGGPGAALDRLTALGAPLWVDLKGRQLRVAEAAIPPFTAVRLSHPISLRTPTDAFFADGTEHAIVVDVDGDRLILADGPRRLIGPGESVNLPDASLGVHGTLTATDRAYLEAMAERGLTRVMLSFCEVPSDADEVRALLPGAEVVQKIESRKGLWHARDHGPAGGRLMAARGDLFVEVREPHKVLGAVRDVLRADPDAIVGSRILASLARGPVPDSADLSDVAWLLSLGCRTLMLGDAVCLRRQSVLAALDALSAIARAEGVPT